MYGRYNRLGEFAKLESLKAAEKKRVKAEKARKSELRGYQGKTVLLSFRFEFQYADGHVIVSE